MKAYSYQRFSSGKEEDKDSFRRQQESAERFAHTHDLILDDTLRFRDPNTSGFRGKHRKEGALSEFLRLVNNGMVPRGSYILIEDFDRLSRENYWNTSDMIRNLLKAGLVFALTMDNQVFDYEKYGSDPGLRNYIDWRIQKAHDDSEVKSIRIKAARNSARDKYFETGKRLTAMSPVWLTLNDDREGWTVHTNIVKVIELIHQWYVDGKSRSWIVRTLNESNKYWKPEPSKRTSSGGWINSTIKSLLGDHRLIGHYQFHERDEEGRRVPIGEVIPDYYPNVMKHNMGLWQRVRNLRDANEKLNKGHGGGNTKQNYNLVVHMVKCSECGGPLHLVFKRPDHPNSKYLECDNKRYHKTDQNGKRICTLSKNLRYYDVERAFFTRFKNLDLDTLMPNKDELQLRIDSVGADLAIAQGKLDHLEDFIENLTTGIGETKNPKARAHLTEKLDSAFVEQEAFQADIQRLTASLTNLRSERKSLKEKINVTKELYELLDNTPEEERPELRKRIHNQIRSWVSRIVPYRAHTKGFKRNTVKALRIYFHEGYSQTLITDWIE